MNSLADQIGQAGSLLGLLLALDTLFTAVQAQALADERNHEGGARPKRVRTIRTIAIGLAVVTVSALVALFPLVRDVLATIGTGNWEPVLGVFDLTWLLLAALAIWQGWIALRSG